MNPGPRQFTVGTSPMPKWVFRNWHSTGGGRLTALVKGRALVADIGDTIHAEYHGDVRIERKQERQAA